MRIPNGYYDKYNLNKMIIENVNLEFKMNTKLGNEHNFDLNGSVSGDPKVKGITTAFFGDS